MKRTLSAMLWIAALGGAAHGDQAQTPFRDDAKAHAAYGGMVAAIRKAKSLSWTADYRCSNAGQEIAHTTYKIWLQKPNYARLEVSATAGSKPMGVMVLDGSTIWVYWPGGKPAYPWDQVGKRAEEFNLYSHRFYDKQNAPLARHSIGHVATEVGPLVCMTVLDPSTFHGYTDSLQPYIDGVRFVGDRRIAGEDCLGIEVSFMKHQRSWVIWLSKKDRIPRRLEETIRVRSDIVVTEQWSNVKINAAQSSKLFAWSPPKGWKLYRMPQVEEGLLAVGTAAPDFEVAGMDGGKLRLSDYRGKVVWLNKWRCG